MRNLTATEVARRFSDVLDAVGRGETFVVIRRGRPVARIGPVAAARGAEVKEILRARPRDDRWAAELRELRSGLDVEERDWPG